MSNAVRFLAQHGGTGRARPHRVTWPALTLATAVGVASCSVAAAGGRPAHLRSAACVRRPAVVTSVLGGPPQAVAAGLTRLLFSCAPVVVVAADRRADLPGAVADAARAHAPLLLAGPPDTAGPGAGPPTTAAQSADLLPGALRAQIRALDPRAVLAAGIPAGALAAQLPRIRVVTSPARLPRTTAAAPLARVTVLVHRRPSAAVLAASATARAAGALVVTVRGDDPRADPAAITALAAAQPRQVLAVGGGFGPAARLAARVAVAATGVQLPGGGQIVVPMHRLVALYGHPGAPSLGALGEQDLQASIARARAMARPYRALSRVPVIPAFEIIATVAGAFPGPDNDYSYASSAASLRPWVRAATAAGMYVVLDLQPGRASLLTQAKWYRSLLTRPNVGLALDPEWKLQPGQLPLRQIGSVRIGEVNSVIRWLARLTARHHLPQKLLVLHQFRLSMILGESRLDTRYDDLAIVIHMDGQGTPGDKEQTWNAVTGAAPPGVFFGWKNFLVKDRPMLTPQQTMAHAPQPVMISYQ
ncbi:MAG: hypothetical protein ACLQDY_10445 [Streptosporangiaceae bacterium]